MRVTSAELYVVATPIGNMSDISARALETLKKVDYVVSEDARITGRLLKHYNIEKQQILYRDENRHKALPKILELLTSGKALALTSDSGTPLISDPGFKLVRAVLDAGFKVLAVPGPSAVIAALSISGLPTDKFIFLGFLPRKASARAEILEKYGVLDATLVLYESPYRVLKLLTEIQTVLRQRYVCVAKELTKVYETVFFGSVQEVIAKLEKSSKKGEFVVMVAKEGFEV